MAIILALVEANTAISTSWGMVAIISVSRTSGLAAGGVSNAPSAAGGVTKAPPVAGGVSNESPVAEGVSDETPAEGDVDNKAPAVGGDVDDPAAVFRPLQVLLATTVYKIIFPNEETNLLNEYSSIKVPKLTIDGWE